MSMFHSSSSSINPPASSDLSPSALTSWNKSSRPRVWLQTVFLLMMMFCPIFTICHWTVYSKGLRGNLQAMPDSTRNGPRQVLTILEPCTHSPKETENSVNVLSSREIHACPVKQPEQFAFCFNFPSIKSGERMESWIISSVSQLARVPVSFVPRGICIWAFTEGLT